jgi:TolB-like protein
MSFKYCTIVIFAILYCYQSIASERVPIAVLELNAEGISASDARIISDRLRTDLFRMGEFTVLEREKMNDILNEQGFQQTGCTTNECAVEIGKLIGVKKIVAGYIGKIGSLITLNIRLIDVQTGEVTRTATEDCRCTLEDILTNSVHNAAKQLSGKQNKDIQNPPPKFFSAYVKSIFIEPGMGLGFGNLGSDKMAIGCIVTGDFFHIGRIGINYLGVLKRAENFTVQYEYLFKSIVYILPKIGFGYISDKYDYRYYDYYYYSIKIEKKSEGTGILLGISLEKYLSQSYYLKIGYDNYISLDKSKKRSANSAMLISLGFKIY